MDQVLLDFGKDGAAQSVAAGSGATASVVTSAHGAVVRMAVAETAGPHSVALRAPDGHWDVSDRLYVAVDLHNPGSRQVKVFVDIGGRGADVGRNRNEVATVLAPGESKRVSVLIIRLPLGDDSPLGRYFAGATGVVGGEYHSGMLGLPGGFAWHWNRIDPAQVTEVVVSAPFATGGDAIEIGRVLSTGRYDPPSAGELQGGFTPFVDAFGQYRHREWPGKVHSQEDLAQARDTEEADLSSHPGPAKWNAYGGWAAGPQFEATGFFHPAKHEGKWWLVDPEGRLFWSHGIDCVNYDWASTRIKGREHFFASLPDDRSPLSACYVNREGERYGYSFAQANLWRKYGEGWRAGYPQLVHKRLRSWGMNTVANWSSPEIYLLRRTPYVVDIHYGSRSIEGSHNLPDPFHSGFRVAMRESIAHRRESAGDPWCIGYFVDNELGWQGDVEAALLVAKAPSDQPAKRELLNDLRAKYRTVGALNASWGTRYTSWEGLLECREAPDLRRSHEDLAAFFERMADTYFRVCREEVKAASPTALYLGCRMNNINSRVVRLAAKHCDVVSINCYQYDVRMMPLPEGIDAPVIIGEWHFGALDRGPLHPGLRQVHDQAERALLYGSYLDSALSHPLMVGAHWFQYGDQATTGRDDGENCQVGFVDTCDTPYPETVQACREIGYAMYQHRLQSAD